MSYCYADLKICGVVSVEKKSELVDLFRSFFLQEDDIVLTEESVKKGGLFASGECYSDNDDILDFCKNNDLYLSMSITNDDSDCYTIEHVPGRYTISRDAPYCGNKSIGFNEVRLHMQLLHDIISMIECPESVIDMEKSKELIQEYGGISKVLEYVRSIFPDLFIKDSDKPNGFIVRDAKNIDYNHLIRTLI